MTRSRSRSPRWKHRSPSPTHRSPENFRPRPFNDHYGGEFRRGTRRPMHWRDEEGNYGSANLRFPPHENVHHRPFGPRPPSPNLRRTPPPFDNVDRYKPFRNLSPQRGLGNRRYPYPPHPPRHPDSYKEQDWNFHQQKPPGRYMGEEPRPYRGGRGGRGGRTFRGPFAGSFRRDERWNENDNFRNPRMEADTFSQLHRRSPEEFETRGSYHKRFPEDREFKEYGPIPKRGREMERYENRGPSRPSNWKPDHSPPADKWGPRAQQSMERENEEEPAVSKVPFNYSRKYPDGKQAFDGQVQKSARLEGQKYKSPTVTLPSKELDCHSDKVKPTEEKKQQKTTKSNSKKGRKEDGNARPVSSKPKERVKKEDGDVRPLTGKTKERIKKVDGESRPVTVKTKEKVKKADGDARPVTGKTKGRVKKVTGDARSVAGKTKERVRKEVDAAEDPDSTTSMHEQSPMSSELKMAANGSPRLKMITVKVDMKKTVDKYRLGSGSMTERQMSQDLFAVTKKKEDFHPVFEHIDSETQSGPNSPKTEFTQEVIIITHQVKANYFKSSDLTLHERFSKLKDKDVEDISEVTVRSDPEIHRRIDISLEDLQNKCASRNVSEQISSGSSFIKGKTIVKVIENPRDLRHDIERRRKKRLLSGDDRAFSPDTSGRSQIEHCLKLKPKAGKERRAKDKGDSSFSGPLNSKPEEFHKPARFMRPPFRNSIGRFHMRAYHSWRTHDRFTGRSQYGAYFEDTRGIRRPFKHNFTDGRFQPHFKSGLVQRGMYIQAKYQHFRSTGRGLTTYKYRERVLKKEEDVNVQMKI